MKVSLFTLIFSSLTCQLYAQVGIGTNSPQALLDVKAQNSSTKPDGILIPRISRDRAKNMVGMVNSTMVYIEDVTGYDGTDTTSIVSYIDEKGFYFYKASSNKWVKLPDFDQMTNSSYWKAQGSSSTTSPKNSIQNKNYATSGDISAVDIYQKGKVGIGYDSSEQIGKNFDVNKSQKQLEVLGDFRSLMLKDNTYFGIETNSIALPSSYATRGNVIYSGKSKNLEDFSYTDRLYDGSMILQSNSELYFLSRTGIKSTTSNSVSNEFQLYSNGIYNFLYTSNVDSSKNKSRLLTYNLDKYSVANDLNENIQFGLKFENTNNAFYIGESDVSEYKFPNTRGLKDQILKLADNNGNLEWTNTSTIKSSPQFFYMPSVALPTSSTSTVIDFKYKNPNYPATSTDQFITIQNYTYDNATEKFTVDLYKIFKSQFQVPVASSDVNETLDGFVLTADKYSYFVIYADASVFDSIAVSTEGILTYKVKADVIVRNGSFMNVVIKLK